MWNICIIAIAFAIIANLISAPTYGMIFVAIVLLDLIAVFMLIHIVRSGRFSRMGIASLGVLAAYTLLDAVLRSTVGVRVLDAVL